METALIFLIWALFVGVIIFSILGGVYLSVLTDRAQANAEAIRADIKWRQGSK